MSIMKSETALLIRRIITSKTSAIANKKFCVGRALSSDNNENVAALRDDNVANNDDHSKSINEIVKHFSNIDFTKLVNKLPSRIMRQRKFRPPHLYLFDNSIADYIFDLIEADLLDHPNKIVEANPGMGILTEKLLSVDPESITVMEPTIRFVQLMSRLQTKYPNKICIREADLLSIWSLAYQDKQDDGTRLNQLFSNFPRLKWGDELGLTIIGALVDSNFIKHLILDTIRQCGIISYGRPRLYLCIPPSIWVKLTASNMSGYNDYRSISIFFQLLFELQLLGQVPRKAYLPWAPSYNSNPRSKLSLRKKLDTEYLYIAKIEGRRNLFPQIIDEKHLQSFWYFINHNMVARSGRVIPQMEAWQPGCGPGLIMQGFNIFTQFGELSPEQHLKLFKQFITWDGYQNSFIPSMENSTQKMEQLLF